MSVREGSRKLASLGHEILDSGAPFSYARLFKNDRYSPGKSFLSLVWMKHLLSNGLIDSPPAALSVVLPLARDYLSHLAHPTGQNMWSFFLDPEGTTANEAFWQTASDPRFDELWSQPESLGWLFQYYIEPGLDIFRSQTAPKITKSQLAMRTQQFTPQWISDFLVQNTLGKLWYGMHPDSRLPEQWAYFVPPANPFPPCHPKSACELKILDPACGTMHLGLAALKVLVAIYREELAHAGDTGWPEKPSVAQERDIMAAIVQNNLYGIDLDPLAIELSALTLSLACRSPSVRTFNLLQTDSLKPNIHHRFREGSFPEAFDVILLNPPYLDKRDYNPMLKAFMLRQFKNNGRNLYTAFLERATGFLAPGGRLGAVTPQTFMFISSFDTLRQILLEGHSIETLVHTGLNTFDDAVVDCAFYVLRREDLASRRETSEASYFHLTSYTSPEEKNAQLIRLIDGMKKEPEKQLPSVYTYRQTDFNALPGSPWVYWIGANIRRLFCDLPPLGQKAELRQGLATTDNGRFLRFWWEIPREQVACSCQTLREAAESGNKWFPYLKGGAFKKWYGNREYLVNWGNDGQEIKEEITRRYPYLKGEWRWVAKNTEYYFREGVSYSYLTSGKFSARLSPAGSIFDVAGSSIFTQDPLQVLGILNSRFCRFALGLINHTVNFQVGDLGKLPMPRESSLRLVDLVTEAIEQTRRLETFNETSPEFIAPAPWADHDTVINSVHRRLNSIQQEIDCEVYRLYRLDSEDQKLIEAHTVAEDPPTPFSSQSLAEDWLSYAVGIALGRFHPLGFELPNGNPFLPLIPDRNGDVSIHSDVSSHFCTRVTAILRQLLGPAAGNEVIRQATGGETLYSYLAKPFFDRHYRQYQHRPVYWLLKQKKKLYAVYYLNLTDEALRTYFRNRKTPIHFDTDDGIRAAMKQIRNHFAISGWSRELK